MLGTLVAILSLAGIGWLWITSLQAREAATIACRRFCEAHDLQFLDETVALSRLELARARPRGLGIRRVYAFEFSRAGTDRGAGAVTLTGPHVESIYLPLLDEPQ